MCIRDRHLEDYLTNYVDENSTVNSYPKAYLKNVKGLLKYDDEYTLSYYNQMFSQYGVDTYENIWDSKDGINNEIEYERDLTKRAKETVKTAMAVSYTHLDVYKRQASFFATNIIFPLSTLFNLLCNLHLALHIQ